MKYLLKITERHCRHVIVDGENKEEAEQNLQEQYDNGEIYLDNDDLIESEIGFIREATHNDKLLYGGGFAKIESYTFDGYIHMSSGIDEYLPEELLKIQKEWGEKADAHGNAGSCVLGAGFLFEYKDLKYKMPPRTSCQGSVSWEVFIDETKAKLMEIGATNIQYEWGNMD